MGVTTRGPDRRQTEHRAPKRGVNYRHGDGDLPKRIRRAYLAGKPERVVLTIGIAARTLAKPAVLAAVKALLKVL